MKRFLFFAALATMLLSSSVSGASRPPPTPTRYKGPPLTTTTYTFKPGFAPAATRRASFGTNNTNPQPASDYHFLMGFYLDDGFAGGEIAVSDYETDLNIIHLGGFTLVHLAATSVDATSGSSIYVYVDEVLDYAYNHGIAVILKPDRTVVSGDNGLTAFTAGVNHFKAKPAIWGYDVQDDCNYVNGYSQIGPETAAVHTNDPGRTAFTSCTNANGGTVAQNALVGANADAFGNQSYNASGSNQHTIISDGNTYRDTAAYWGKWPISIPQSMSVGPGDPTVDQARFQAWANVASGFKSILWFDWDNGLTSRLSDRNAPLWNELKAIRTDIANYSGYFINGTYARPQVGTYYEEGTHDTATTHWRFITVVAAEQDTSVTIPLGGKTAYKAFDDPRYFDLTYSGSGTSNQLSGTIPAFGVAVYVVDIT